MALRKPLFVTSSGFHEEMNPADELELGKLTMSGIIDMNTQKITELAQASAAGDALGWELNAKVMDFHIAGKVLADIDMDSKKIVNLALCTSANDAANKGYVDSVAQGLDVKKSVRVIARTNITLSGTQTIDGVAVVAGDRVLVAGQTAAADNGIYVVASGSWTRSEDADGSTPSNDLNPGAFTFIEEGTVYHDCGFVMSSDEPFTLGTTAQVWTQFSRAGVLNPRNGLLLTGLDVDVRPGKGIAIDGSNDVSVTFATDHGLQFTTESGKDKLDLKLFSADQLTADSGGLKVAGVPAQFKVAGTQVSVNVTAPNLDTLTAGPASSAESLHIHGYVEHAYTDAGGLAVGDPIYFSAADTAAKSEASTDAKRWVNGVVRSVGAGVAQVVSFGLAKGVLSGATAGARYWLSAAGGYTATKPTASGSNIIQLGVAVNATDLFVHIIDQGKLA